MTTTTPLPLGQRLAFAQRSGELACDALATFGVGKITTHAAKCFEEAAWVAIDHGGHDFGRAWTGMVDRVVESDHVPNVAAELIAMLNQIATELGECVADEVNSERPIEMAIASWRSDIEWATKLAAEIEAAAKEFPVA